MSLTLKCTHCGHVWTTRKDKIPSQCPFCKYSTYYYKPIIIKKKDEIKKRRSVS